MKAAGSVRKQELTGRFFIGKIVSEPDADTAQLERVRVRVPHVFDDMADEDLPWAIPVKQRGNGAIENVGTFGVPVKGTDVFVLFEAGDIYSPLYFGSVVTAEDMKMIAGTTYGKTVGMQDPSGNYMYLDYATNIAKFHHVSGTEIIVAANGAVTITAVNNVIQNITGTLTQTVSGNVSTTSTGGNVSISAPAGNVSITSATNATITVGGSSISVTPSSVSVISSGDVTIQGSLINLN